VPPRPKRPTIWVAGETRAAGGLNTRTAAFQAAMRAGCARSRCCHHASIHASFLPVRFGGGGTERKAAMIQRRVSAGSITSSNSSSVAAASALPRSYMRATISSNFALRSRRVFDRGEFVAVAELDCAFQSHAAEFAGGPGDGKERRHEARSRHACAPRP